MCFFSIQEEGYSKPWSWFCSSWRPYRSTERKNFPVTIQSALQQNGILVKTFMLSIKYPSAGRSWKFYIHRKTDIRTSTPTVAPLVQYACSRLTPLVPIQQLHPSLTQPVSNKPVPYSPLSQVHTYQTASTNPAPGPTTT